MTGEQLPRLSVTVEIPYELAQALMDAYGAGEIRLGVWGPLDEVMTLISRAEIAQREGGPDA